MCFWRENNVSGRLALRSMSICASGDLAMRVSGKASDRMAVDCRIDQVVLVGDAAVVARRSRVLIAEDPDDARETS